MPRDTPERLVMAKASRQLGLVLRDQAVEAGLTPRVIHQRLAVGRWRQVTRGLYVVTGTPVTWETLLLGACLVGGPGAAASHDSAAVLWGLSAKRKYEREISVPPGRSGRAAARLAVVHHACVLGRQDVTRIGRIPVTRPERTLVDLGGRLSPPALCGALDEAIIRGLTDPRKLEARLVLAAPRRRAGAAPSQAARGAPALRAALAAWTPGPVPGSVAEMQVIRCLLAHGVPTPQRQVEVRDGERVVARLDHAWPAARVALETAGWRWHGGPLQFHRDHQRALQVRALGWDLLTATPSCLDDGGERLARAVSAALRRSGWPAPAAPRG